MDEKKTENGDDSGLLRVNDESVETVSPPEVSAGDDASLGDSHLEGEQASESSVDESVRMMEAAADYAEQDANDINHAKKLALASERNPSGATLPANDSSEVSAADVRQDFLDQMHQPKLKYASKVGMGKKIAIGLAVVILLTLTGGFLWWYAYYSQPNTVLANALGKLLSANYVTINAELTTTAEDDGELVAKVATLNGQMQGLTNFSQRLDLSSYMLDDGEHVDGNQGLVAEVALLDGEIAFAKIDGLDNIEYDAEDEDTAEALEALGEIEGKWYQLNIEDVLQFLGINQATAQPITDFYYCGMEIARSGYAGELSGLYESYPFLSAKRSPATPVMGGATVYDLTVDYVVLAGFLNSLPYSNTMEAFYSCYNVMARELGRSELSPESFTEFDAETLAEILPADYILQLEISDFGHDLVRLFASMQDGGVERSLEIKFGYTYQELAMPDTYWTAEDMVDLLQDYYPILWGQIVDFGGFRDYTEVEEEFDDAWYNDNGNETDSEDDDEDEEEDEE